MVQARGIGKRKGRPVVLLNVDAWKDQDRLSWTWCRLKANIFTFSDVKAMKWCKDKVTIENKLLATTVKGEVSRWANPCVGFNGAFQIHVETDKEVDFYRLGSGEDSVEEAQLKKTGTNYTYWFIPLSLF